MVKVAKFCQIRSHCRQVKISCCHPAKWYLIVHYLNVTKYLSLGTVTISNIFTWTTAEPYLNLSPRAEAFCMAQSASCCCWTPTVSIEWPVGQLVSKLHYQLSKNDDTTTNMPLIKLLTTKYVTPFKWWLEACSN